MQQNNSIENPENFVSVNCTRLSGQVNELANCSYSSWGLHLSNGSPGKCRAETYIGNACRQQLMAWQECAFGSAGDVFLDASFMHQSQPERERNAARFLHFLCELFDTS